MKKLLLLSLFILAAFTLQAATGSADTLKQKSSVIISLDSLKQKLQLITYDSLKAPVYTDIANHYLKYDTIPNINRQRYYQTEALNHTMMALHLYSRYGDSSGLRVSFDALAKVYYSQRKFAQAKWFILQSAGISRLKNDVPNLIASLIKISAIKMEIKEYKLAMNDLNEALALTIANQLFETEATIQKNFGFLYNRMENYPKGELAIKRADAIMESIRTGDKAAQIALQGTAYKLAAKKAAAAAKKKKADALAAKKNPKKEVPKKIAAPQPILLPDSLNTGDDGKLIAVQPITDSGAFKLPDTLVSNKTVVVAAKKAPKKVAAKKLAASKKASGTLDTLKKNKVASTIAIQPATDSVAVKMPDTLAGKKKAIVASKKSLKKVVPKKPVVAKKTTLPADSLIKTEAIKIIPQQLTADSGALKKTDTAIVKKKAVVVAPKKAAKKNASKKIVASI